jgi:hypothetical protein
MRPKPQATHGVATGHESKDISMKWIVRSAAVLLASAVIVHAGVWWLDRALGRARQPAAVARAPEEGGRLNAEWARFAEPHLQISPRLDLAGLSARENAELHSYGWVNRDAGVVHIPIERAMELLLERGLPVSTNGVAKGTKRPLDMLYERRLLESGKPEGRP